MSTLIYCVYDYIRTHCVDPRQNSEQLNFVLFSYLDKLYATRKQLFEHANFNQTLLLEDLFCRWESCMRQKNHVS